MSAKDQSDPPRNNAAASMSLAESPPEPPFSIFDRRQKWLLVVLVSTAATCESELIHDAMFLAC